MGIRARWFFCGQLSIGFHQTASSKMCTICALLIQKRNKQITENQKHKSGHQQKRYPKVHTHTDYSWENGEKMKLYKAMCPDMLILRLV